MADVTGVSVDDIKIMSINGFVAAVMQEEVSRFFYKYNNNNRNYVLFVIKS